MAVESVPSNVIDIAFNQVLWSWRLQERKTKNFKNCQARVHVPNTLSQQAPNPDPKVRPSLKNQKTQFFGLGWHNNHMGLGLRMIPFTHPAQKIDKVDSENKDMG